jgi:hypothetical protein
MNLKLYTFIGYFHFESFSSIFTHHAIFFNQKMKARGKGTQRIECTFYANLLLLRAKGGHALRKGV